MAETGFFAFLDKLDHIFIIHAPKPSFLLYHQGLDIIWINNESDILLSQYWYEYSQFNLSNI